MPVPTALGKALLAHNPDAIDAVIARGLTARTPHTTIEESAFRAELQRVRAAGIATSCERRSRNASVPAGDLGRTTGKGFYRH